MVAWTTVRRPKNQGGLGVLNINIQNNALLLKNLHKFFNTLNIPWVNLIWDTYYNNGQVPGHNLVGSFWWKANLNLLDHYKSMARCVICDGKSALSWTDLWDKQCMSTTFPHLLSFSKNNMITVE